jgi:hypothetical protein
MSKQALAVAKSATKPVLKVKPRYTDDENQLLFDSWWHPQKRRELSAKLGRAMSALRSQFCRLLKEKGISNQDYYKLMQKEHAVESGSEIRKRNPESKAVDRIILETFCKHQALGNSRTQACLELQQILGGSFTEAALKLRFYRLVKMTGYRDDDLLRMGRQLLGDPAAKAEAADNARPVPAQQLMEERAAPPARGDNSLPAVTNRNGDNFLYAISSLPETVQHHESRLVKLEEQQRHQLDLRGFIEHLLAVERDLKREDKLMEEIQILSDENENLRTLIDKEREKLKKRETELAEVYQLLEKTLSDFMNLESVSKLASLGDFMHRLEITVDQFGNVLKSKRVLM